MDNIKENNICDIDHIRELTKSRLLIKLKQRMENDNEPICQNSEQSNDTGDLAEIFKSTIIDETELINGHVDKNKYEVYRKLIKSILEYYRENNVLRVDSLPKRDKGKVNYTAETFQCTNCNKKFESEKVFRRHYNYYKNNGSDCNELLDGSINENNLHVKLNSKSKPFPCILCKTHFKTRENLEKHNLSIHIKKYHCVKCNLKFPSSIAKNFHVNKIHINNPHVCNICYKSFKWKHNLVKHNISEHKRISTKKNKSSRKKNLVELKLIKCDLCTTTFMHASSYRRHLLRIHPQQQIVPKLIKCKVCPNRFQNLQSITIHMKRYHSKTSNVKSHSCERCAKPFRYPYLLERHKTRCLVESAMCDICKKLLKPSYVPRHMRRIHNIVPIPRNQCSTCNKSFADLNLLNSHRCE